MDLNKRRCCSDLKWVLRLNQKRKCESPPWCRIHWESPTGAGEECNTNEKNANQSGDPNPLLFLSCKRKERTALF